MKQQPIFKFIIEELNLEPLDEVDHFDSLDQLAKLYAGKRETELIDEAERFDVYLSTVLDGLPTGKAVLVALRILRILKGKDLGLSGAQP